jgi:hypothetical protein
LPLALLSTAAEVGALLGPLVFGAMPEATGGFALPLWGLSLVCIALMGVLARLYRSRGTI